MRIRIVRSAPLVIGVALLVSVPILHSEQPPAFAAASSTAEESIPDALEPKVELAAAPAPDAEFAVRTQSAAPTPVPSDSSSSQSSAPPPAAQETQKQKAAEQIKEQEQQRVGGVIPAFNVSYRSDAVSMSPSQKISLAFHSSIDPFTFAGAFMVAGYHEALDEDTGFGWGAEGFGKRAGAAYLDAVNGTMIGNGFLPVIFHQDPRYFRLGHGSTTHRLLYAISTSYICKHDNTGRWEPNYSNVGGNIIAGAISNLYYPSQNSGWGQTISNGFIVTTEGTIGGVFDEFWPDISRKFFHKDPTHGQDAQMRAEDKENKAQQPQK